MISLERYRALLARLGIPRLFLASIVGRLPIGMSGLAILLLVQSETVPSPPAVLLLGATSPASPALRRYWENHRSQRRSIYAAGLLAGGALVEWGRSPAALCAAGAAALTAPAAARMLARR